MVIADGTKPKTSPANLSQSVKPHKKKFLQIRDDKAFQLYIYRVLKQVKPELGISKRAMSQLNQIVADLFERIMEEARKLVNFSKKQTLSSREIETAVKLLFQGELGKHAIHEGRQSMQKYMEKSGQ